MMKSYVSYVQGLFQAILADCEEEYPHLQKDFGRDLSRLLSCVEARGLSYVMIDLPSFAKHLDVCLAKERLTLSRLPTMSGYRKGTVIPRLFKGLLLRVFNDSGELRLNRDIRAIQHLRQLLNCAKKLRIDSNDERKRETLKSFFAIEQTIRRGSSSWDYDEPRWGERDGVHIGQSLADPHHSQGTLFPEEEDVCPVSRGHLDTIQGVFDVISSQIGVFNPEFWKAKHGPGAVSDLFGKGSKYLFPSWPDKLERVFPLSTFAFANEGFWADTASSFKEGCGRFSRNEYPSKLILVPKTLKAPRLIASEPVSHQWCQQVLKDFLTRRSEQTLINGFITFRDQTANQKLALQGSLRGDVSTIDLSEASDRLSLWLVERAFRGNHSLLDALHAVRTRWVTNPLGYGLPKYHKLRKFACMGSACTFPIQSLVFLGIALGSTLHTLGIRPTLGNIRSLVGRVRVFGDDIIVPTYAVENVMAALALLGLKVNPHKSFWTGRFRESCGIDAFEGHVVTPIYSMTPPRRSRPESIVSAVATHNNFYSKGYWRTASYIKSTVRKVCSRIPNVAVGSGSFGFFTDGSIDNSHLKSRWNDKLHRLERLQAFPQGKIEKSRPEGELQLLQYFTEEPAPTSKWEAGFVVDSRVLLRTGWVGADAHAA